MSLVSISFIGFISAVLLIYFLVPRKMQWMVLIPANIGFVASVDLASLLFILMTAVSVYGYARYLTKSKQKMVLELANCIERSEKKNIKRLTKRRQLIGMWLVLGLNFGTWFGFKCFELAVRGRQIHYWAPFAISFYTFIAAGYLIDVYRGNIEAETNFGRLFVFITYFPQMTEGPFNRYGKTAQSLYQEHSFSAVRLQEGIVRVLWGYCKKLIVADRLWSSLSVILQQDMQVNGLQVFMMLWLLPLQQYMDFSGCMDIVLGVSHIMGIEMQENFAGPEFSKSIAEVWRRWHITLCEWFKEYVFYPVATNTFTIKVQKSVKRINKKAAMFVPSVMAMFCVWTITGIWHGLAWKNVLWGWMNFVILSFSLVMKEAYDKFHRVTKISAEGKWWKLFSIVRTIMLFGVMEIMADATSAGKAFGLYRSMIDLKQWNISAGGALPNMTVGDYWIVAIFSVLVLILDAMRLKGKANLYLGETRVGQDKKRILLMVGLFYAIVLFSVSGTDINAGFAYAKF